MWLGGPWGWKFQEQCLGHLSNDRASVSSFTIRVSQSTTKGQVSTGKKWKIQTASMDTASNSGGSWASCLFGDLAKQCKWMLSQLFQDFQGNPKKIQKMQMLKYWKWHFLGWCILSRDETRGFSSLWRIHLPSHHGPELFNESILSKGSNCAENHARGNYRPTSGALALNT